MKTSSLAIIVVSIITLVIMATIAEGLPLKKSQISFSIKKIDENPNVKIIANGELCPTCIDLLDFGMADLMAAVDR